jgi:aryl-alcohol dehydrogenase-like predicted oxidoreductase
MSLVTAVIAWTVSQPDISSVIIGVSRPEQLVDQVLGTDRPLPPALKQALDDAWYALPRTPPQLDTPRLEQYF